MLAYRLYARAKAVWTESGLSQMFGVCLLYFFLPTLATSTIDSSISYRDYLSTCAVVGNTHNGGRSERQGSLLYGAERA